MEGEEQLMLQEEEQGGEDRKRNKVEGEVCQMIGHTGYCLERTGEWRFQT